MAMGKRARQRQQALWIATADIPQSPGHPFYQKLNGLLDGDGFDAFVEQQCGPFYAEVMGRPSIPPAVYFRMLLIGYFEGIDSERGIAWRVADSMSLREFLGYRLGGGTPDHSSVSRTRRLLPLEVHAAVFTWVLTVLAKSNLLKGKTLGIDATTLEANAALRSIVRRDTGETYEAFLTRLAKASGIETPTRQDLARIDKHRKGKGSNKEWEHPHDPDAAITKMKDGRTHLAHKAEHAVDMDTEAIVAVTVQPASEGDTETLAWTLLEAESNLEQVAEEPKAKAKLHDKPLSEAVLDKGYHSNGTMTDLAEAGIRSYGSEPDRGRRKWKGKSTARDAVYANRRRIRGERGKRLLRKRGELLERPFAHLYDTGGMRRTHLRRTGNILKRLLVHAAGFNLGLVMRKLLGRGTPRGLAAASQAFFEQLRALRALARAPWATTSSLCRPVPDYQPLLAAA